MGLDCYDLRNAGITTVPCCNSCHDDFEEFGYDLCEVSHAQVCCAVANDIDSCDPRIETLWEKMQ